MDWSTVWILIGSIGAGIVGIAVLAKYTGGSDLITAVMSVIQVVVDFMRTFISFILENLPKPIRVFLLILMIGLIGGWVYTFTIGMHYLCIEDNGAGKVYETDSPFGGFIVRMWPEDLKGKEILFENQTQVDSVTLGRFGIDKDAWVVGQDNDVLKMEEKNVYGVDYSILYMIATDVKVVSEDDIASIVRKPAKEQFYWLFGDYTKTYDVCYDEETETCILQVETSTDTNACGAGLVSWMYGQGLNDVFTKGSSWDKLVGQFKYFYDDEENEFAALIRDDGFLADNFFDNLFHLRILAMDDCKPFSEDALSDDAIDEGVTTDLLERKLSMITVNAAGASFPLYNAERGVFKVTCSRVDDPNCDPRYFSDTELITKAQATSENFKIVEQKDDDFVNFVCNPETTDEYDVKIELGGDGTPGSGIDPFATSTLVALFFVGALFSVYMFIKRI
jgi:hypothetical protein